MTTSLHWFRNDLRLADNPGLQKAISFAIEPKDNLICLYCHDPALDQILPWGAKRLGPFRQTFLRQTLDALNEDLKKQGSFLVEVYGPAQIAVMQCAIEFGASTITYQAEVSPEEINTEIALRVEAVKHNITLIACDFSTLIDFHKIAMHPQTVSNVFTQFRQEIESTLKIPNTKPAPTNLPHPPRELALYAVVAQNLLPKNTNELNGTDSNPSIYLGGERQAIKRLNHYYWKTNKVASYFETRNEMLDPDTATRFSPWLANGSISARTCFFEIKKYEAEVTKNKSTYWVFFELLWRDFFKAMSLKYGTLLYREQGLQNKKPNRSMPEREEKTRFKSWQEGTTSEPLVNACMRELRATGYMSNRGRQIVASYLINNLDVRWVWGAWHFESLLIDYDAASNWGNWAYLAGVGNDPRGNRVFNTKRQAETYDPTGDFVRHWS